MIIERLKDQLRRQEGCRLKKYQCSANKWTIGYGHCETSGQPIPENCTEKQAEQWLDKDLRDSIRFCAGHIKDFLGLDNVRQAVLINMTFVLGIGGLLGFTKMLKAIHKADWKLAAKEILDSDFGRTHKNRAIELARMMESGHWPGKENRNG